MEYPYDVYALNANYAMWLHSDTNITIDGCTINGDGDNFDSYVGYDDSARVSVTQGSPTVIGTNTNWTSAQVGEKFSVVYDIYYTVDSVQSGTELTLTENYNEATASGQLYGTTGPYEGTVGEIRGSEANMEPVMGGVYTFWVLAKM